MFSMFIELMKSTRNFLSSGIDFRIVDTRFLVPHTVGGHICLIIKDGHKAYHTKITVLGSTGKDKDPISTNSS